MAPRQVAWRPAGLSAAWVSHRLACAEQRTPPSSATRGSPDPDTNDVPSFWKWYVGNGAYGLSMTENPQSDEPRGPQFVDADLRGARIVRSDLSDAVMRGVYLAGADIDGEIGGLRINGVEVPPLVEAELNRRFPGREGRRANDPDGLRENWAVLERTWAATLERVAQMSDGAVDVSVDGEWSFAQTLRHLVLATDAWLRGSILGVAQPFHPIGLPFAEYETDGFDMSIFTASMPSYEEVLDVRAGRVAMVRDYLATVTPEVLLETRPNPWAPQSDVTVSGCLRVILDEEWEHHRYAVRDLDAIEARTCASTDSSQAEFGPSMSKPPSGS